MPAVPQRREGGSIFAAPLAVGANFASMISFF